ncbi:hypothetical protein JDN40_14385 [Rhodomicrobium vannielii ATCC 17100]|uniref:hypothetical protein n=1 Tax=Rhodomicrobium vannielii TaxID=1069 RepID=UPI0019191627|nr:hypothetical protein [Rhodomicrobium vannielii]MBJ7535296.1 hypothetical protein [Rhodomicrobium vannielii ATCC 17100]
MAELPIQSQGALFDLDDLADMPGPLADVQPKKGAGRPKGAINRSTKDWREAMLAKYRSPLVVLAEIYSRPTSELARALDCAPLEALKVQKGAAEALAPYLHSRMPQDVNVTAKTAGVIAIVEPGSLTSDSDGMLTLTVVSNEENQALSAVDAQQSDEGKVGR